MASAARRSRQVRSPARWPLIQRGTCEFGVKVLNAEKAGATFAVIYNSTAVAMG